MAVEKSQSVEAEVTGFGSASPSCSSIAGIRLTVHVLGSRGCGKHTLYTQWMASSVFTVLSRFADVQMRLEDGVGSDALQSLDDPLWISTSVFVVVYSNNDSHSVNFAKQCLSIITTSFTRHKPKVFLLENMDNPNFDAESQEPTETPDGEFNDFDVPYFVVNVKKSIQLPGVFEHIIVRPLMDTMKEEDVEKAMRVACQGGHCSVLKLFTSAGKQPHPRNWIEEVFKRLSSLTVTHPTVPSLLEIAEFAYNLDSQTCLDYVLSQLSLHPTACLIALNHLSDPTNPSPQHLLLEKMKLKSIPAAGVTNAAFTHICLARNDLESVPEELMQLSLLTALDLSHNKLQEYPSVLRWNCPKLRELKLSHNSLLDTSEKLLKRTGGAAGGYSSLPTDRHSQPQQKLLQLTGHNLYPCVYSLASVDLSHNPRMARVPEWVCILPNLAFLNLKGLPKLKQLPYQLAIWSNLAIIVIDTENMISPPHSVCVQGSQAITAYLRCQLRGSLHYRHMRLMLLGKAGVGKTTTFRQLVSEKNSKRHTGSSMEVASYDYRSSGKQSVKVTYHLIDFAEDPTTAVYKCFLTKRCIYLCLWNVTEGKKGLEGLLPWLHCIHSSVSNAAIILVGTHADWEPKLTSAQVSQWQQEVFHFSELTDSHGLPLVSMCILINAQDQHNIEQLKKEIHAITMKLTSPSSYKLLMEEQVPRSYIELQGMVENKVKHSPNRTHIETYEEFIDNFRSIGHHYTSWDITNDEEEFALACQFLHDAGVIVQCLSTRQQQSSIFFLCPQWLSDTLSDILKNRFKAIRGVGEERGGAVISSYELQQILVDAMVPPKHSQQFTHMMEQYNMVVALNMERSQFLVPSLLPSKPPSNYPVYDLSAGVLAQCTMFPCLGGPVFQLLQTRILLRLHQLGAQLITMAPELAEMPESCNTFEDTDGQIYKEMDVQPQAEVQIHVNGELADEDMVLQTEHQSLGVDRRGYIFLKDSMDALQDKEDQEHSFKTVFKMLRAMSIPDADDDQPELRDGLHNNINVLARPLIQRLSSYSPDHENITIPWFSTDQYSKCLLWENGMHIDFMCGTKAWVEVLQNGVATVVTGSELARVKTLTFLSHCLDSVLEDSYPLLKPVTYSPCPSCLSSAHGFFFLSQELQPVPENPYSANGPTVSTTPLATGDLAIRDPLVSVNNQILLFPASYLIQSLKRGGSLSCPRCMTQPLLYQTAPHLQLADFDELPILQQDKLVFSETLESQLGSGGYANVYHGTYHNADTDIEKGVAVKVFRESARDTTASLKELRRELTILNSIRHPLILPPIGVHLHPMGIVFELAPFGTLQDHLLLCPSGLEEQTSHQLLYQISSGLQYLHSLSIIHRDVKPSNVLVWSLHPRQGVKIRISDCGISQFSTPRGLRVATGTEEYMAPELMRNRRNRSYTEKVDIFSFGILLHYVVTGSKLMPFLLHKNLTKKSFTSSLNLTKPIAAALDEHRTRTVKENAATAILEGGVHPAGRGNHVTMCITACMQPLLLDCLSPPPDRPSAMSISHRLLLCCGFIPQEKIILHGRTHISQAFLSKEAGCIVGQLEDTCEVTVLALDTYAPVTSPLPCKENGTPLLAVVGGFLVVARQTKQSLLVYKLPELSTVGKKAVSLSYKPSCLFTYQTSLDGDCRVVVGTEAGHILVFSASEQAGMTQLYSKQVFNLHDAKKCAVKAGVYYRQNLLCGCGRYLIGLHSDTLEQKFIRPVSDKNTDRVVSLAVSQDKVWIMMAISSDVVVCDATTGNRLSTIDCRELLVQGGVPLVSMVTAGPEVVWVGTQTGYLLGFNPRSLQLTVVTCRVSCVDSVVCVGDGVIVMFGRWVIEGTSVSGFTVWHSHINMMS